MRTAVLSLIMLTSALWLPAGCTSEEHNEFSSVELPRQIGSMADWLKIKQARIQTTADYLETLKDLHKTIHGDPAEGSEVDENGFSLVNAVAPISQNRIVDLGNRLQRQGITLQEYDALLNSNVRYMQNMANLRQSYMAMANQGTQNFLNNQRSWLANGRAVIDNEGARIENFGRSLKNYGQGLENILKELEVVLKGYYAMGYANYTDAYVQYTDQIQKIWKQIGRANGQIGGAMVQLNEYRRQANICEARRQRIMTRKYRIANDELHMKEVSLNKIPHIVDHLTTTPEGEQCMQKVLLTRQFQNMDELFRIEYEVDYTDRKLSIQCPTISRGEGLDGVPVSRYPMPIVNEETYQVEGYFQPVTYYQMVRVLSSMDAPIRIAPPAANPNGGGCNIYHPVSEEYLNTSREAEKSLADTYETVLPPTAGQSLGYTARLSTIPRDNRPYRLMLNRMTQIFRDVEQCTDLALSRSDDETPPVAGDASFQAGDKAKSDFNVYFDPDFPLMSETIRECSKIAESHRYRAFARLETIDFMMGVLEKAASMKPPRSPHPVQFQPGAPNTRNGNDF